MKPALALLALATLLTACGPTYRTNYNLLPPATQSGQLCAMNVKSMSDVCVANCQMMGRSCRNYGPGGGIGLGYGRREGFIAGGGYNDTLLDDRDCSTVQCESNCLAAARTSHLSCGGSVTRQTVCTSNCPPPQPVPVK